MLRLFLVLVLVLATAPARAADPEAARALLRLIGFEADMQALESFVMTLPGTTAELDPEFSANWQEAARLHMNSMEIFDAAVEEVSKRLSDAEVAELTATLSTDFALRVKALQDKAGIERRGPEGKQRSLELYADIVRTPSACDFISAWPWTARWSRSLLRYA